MSAAARAGGDVEGGGAAARQTEPLARLVFVALVAACFLAFFLTQRLKHAPTVVQQFYLATNFAPTPTGQHKEERISFKLSHAERATVAIIDPHGNVVATLLRAYPVPRYKRLSLRWNGRRGEARSFRTATEPSGHSYLVPRNTGRLAPAGEYRVRLTLSGQSNPYLSLKSFTLVGR